MSLPLFFRILKLPTAISSLALSFTILASDQNGTDVLNAGPSLTKEEVVAAKAEGIQDAFQYVSDRAQAFVEAKMTKFNKENKEVHIHYGSALVAAKPTEARWSDSRIMAYQSAQLKARESFLKQLYTEVSSKTLREAFDSNKLPAFNPEELQANSRLEAILDKVVAVIDGSLDTKLEEMGIDAGDYKASEPTKRKVMMQKAITRIAKQKARGDISGSQIMKSFEATDVNGNTAVAVIIATSVKKKNLLTSLRLSKGNVEPALDKAGIPLVEYLNKQKPNLVYQYGTQVLWDEKGYPMLVSFGMSGNNCNPTDYEDCVDRREFSFADAELDALAHIAESYTLTGNYESERANTEQKIKTATATLDKNKDTDISQETVSEMIKEIKESSELASSVKGLVGLKTALRWTEKHPITNREVNGVVMVWHPKSEQDTRALKEDRLIKKKSTLNSYKSKAGSGESEEASDEGF